MRIRATLVTGTTDITASHPSAELCFVTPPSLPPSLPPSPFPPFPLHRSISQCTDNTRRQKAAIQLQNDLPLLFPVCQPAYLIPKATPSHDPSCNPLALVPRDLQSTALATTSMHLYRLIREALYASLSAFVAPTSAYGSEGGRVERRVGRGGEQTGSPGVIELQQWARVELTWSATSRDINASRRHFPNPRFFHIFRI